MNGKHCELIAIEALKKPPGWECYSWEVKDHGMLVKGAIPHLNLLGEKEWNPLIDEAEFFVTDWMFEQWAKRYTEETGNCVTCIGSGKVFASWNHKTGSHLKDCPDCGGSGKANHGT